VIRFKRAGSYFQCAGVFRSVADHTDEVSQNDQHSLSCFGDIFCLQVGHPRRSAGAGGDSAAAGRRQASGAAFYIACGEVAECDSFRGVFLVRAQVRGEDRHRKDGGDSVVAAACAAHNGEGSSRHAGVRRSRGVGFYLQAEVVGIESCSGVLSNGFTEIESRIVVGGETVFRDVHIHLHAFEDIVDILFVHGVHHRHELRESHPRHFLGDALCLFRNVCGFGAYCGEADFVVEQNFHDVGVASFDAAESGFPARLDFCFDKDSVPLHVGDYLDTPLAQQLQSLCCVLFCAVLQNFEAVLRSSAEDGERRGNIVPAKTLSARNPYVHAVLVDAVAYSHDNAFHISRQLFFRPGDSQCHRSGLGTPEGGFYFGLQKFLDGEHFVPSTQ